MVIERIKNSGLEQGLQIRAAVQVLTRTMREYEGKWRKIDDCAFAFRGNREEELDAQENVRDSKRANDCATKSLIFLDSNYTS